MRKLIFILLLAASSALATIRTWDGGAAVSGRWNNDTNWTDNTKPTTADTVHFDGTSVRSCSLDVSINIKRLKIFPAFTGNYIMTGFGEVVTAGGHIDSGNGGVRHMGDSLVLTGDNDSLVLVTALGTIAKTTCRLKLKGTNYASIKTGGSWYQIDAAYPGKTTTTTTAIVIGNSGATDPVAIFNGGAAIFGSTVLQLSKSGTGPLIRNLGPTAISGTAKLTLNTTASATTTIDSLRCSNAVEIGSNLAVQNSKITCGKLITTGALTVTPSTGATTMDTVIFTDSVSCAAFTTGSAAIGTKMHTYFNGPSFTAASIGQIAAYNDTAILNFGSCNANVSGNIVMPPSWKINGGTSIIRKTGSTASISDFAGRAIYDWEIAKTAAAVDSIPAGVAVSAHNLTVTSGKFRQPANSPIILSGNLVVTTTDTNSRRGEMSIAGDATFAVGAVNSDSVAVMRFTGAWNSVLTCNGTKRARVRLVKSTSAATLTLADSLPAKSLIDSVGAVKASAKAADVDTLYVGDTGCTFARLYVRHVLVIDKPITITQSADFSSATVSVTGTGAILASCGATVTQGTGDAVPVTYPESCGAIIKRVVRGFAARFRWSLFRF